MTKKGELQEWMSRIKYSKRDHNKYSVVFRDFNDYIELPFSQFIARQQEDSIPLHRISQIKKNNIPVFTRPFFCFNCGHPIHQKNCENIICNQYQSE